MRERGSSPLFLELQQGQKLYSEVLNKAMKEELGPGS